MLYTPLTKRAMKFCFDAHAGQVDKCGLSYANHPLHLAEQMRTEDEVCAALLHDVMEDCGKTPDDLRAIGVSEQAIEALLLLTHRDGIPYLDYVRGVIDNPIARSVKIADLRHNSELARLDRVRERDLDRLRKYRKARVLLGDMAYELETPAGVVRVAVNGEPYPFAVERVCEARHGFMGPAAQGPGEARWLEVDTLTLAEGDRVTVECDFGECEVEREVVDGGVRRTLSKNGQVISIFLAGEPAGEDACGESCYRLDRAGDSYEIVDDPVEHRFYPLAHTIGVRVAWS